MKVLIVSTPFIPVPPPTYGGLETIVFNLATGLRVLGADVTVACPTESRLPSGIQHLDIGRARYQFRQDWKKAEEKAYKKYKSGLKKFDIIHDHTWFGWPYMAKLKDPSLKIIHTHHGHIYWRVHPPVSRTNLVAISQYMASHYRAPLAAPKRCVYNGVAMEDYVFSPNRGERLLYLGRMEKIKQPHVAVRLAKLTGVPIDLVGGDRFLLDPDYATMIKDSCNGVEARYVGEVQHEDKLRYLQECRSVVIPSEFEEPFGLVAVEALATGRPVICFNDGALKEIVQHGVTGFVCNSPAQMGEVVREGLDLKLNPIDCRRRAEQFSREIMCQGYVELYRQVVGGAEW